MGKVQKTIKINSEVYNAAEKWLSQSGAAFNFSTMADEAIRRFITRPLLIEPVIMSEKEVLGLADDVIRQHKVALDRMK